jgi:O-antigen/teichoic acid export membrane protein
VLAGVVGYLALLLSLYPSIEAGLLGPHYQGLRTTVAGWGTVTLFGGLGSIGTAVQMALGRYRDAFWSSFAGNALTFALIVPAGRALGNDGIVLALGAGALVSAGWSIATAVSGLRSAPASG